MAFPWVNQHFRALQPRPLPQTGPPLGLVLDDQLLARVAEGVEARRQAEEARVLWQSPGSRTNPRGELVGL